ncbi:protein involved in conjugation [Arthrobacter sp. Hiyo8]|nr:protein involved in conjugation [Arthrobacter sp. Hiyo8]
METSGDAKDVAAVLHARLANFSSRMPAGDRTVIPEPLHTNRPDLADMINQVTHKIRQRAKQVVTAALTQDTEWKRKLVQTLPPNATRTDTARQVARVAIYRDRWGINDSPLPLGPAPADHDWEQSSQYEHLKRVADRASSQATRQQQPGEWLEDSISRQDSPITVGWQL